MYSEREHKEARKKAESSRKPVTIATNCTTSERVFLEGDLLEDAQGWFTRIGEDVFEIHSVTYPSGYGKAG